MSFSNLSEWLTWQETLHPNPVDLGLERITQVLQRLQWRGFDCPVITIGGTKGKGSCAAMSESILQAAGYRVGLFTSPHLRHYNERIRIAGREIADAALCAAFERIDRARAGVTLTYFEFNTLAALLSFAAANLEVVILEVGMGGRLDAVNVIDADVAIVTSIGLDHCEWLGHDLESIGREKAGIMRPGRPAIYGSPSMPESIAAYAEQIGARLVRAGRDFGANVQGDSWEWWCGERRLDALPPPALPGAVQIHNAAAALAALDCLSARVPVTRAAIATGLRQVYLPGRFQVIPGDPEWILDVAHNPMSAQTLANNLAARPRRRTVAVFAALGDKDLGSMVEALHPQVEAWVVAQLEGPRAVPVGGLRDRLVELGVDVRGTAATVAQACELAQACMQASDRVLVFGSFLVVGPALDWLGL